MKFRWLVGVTLLTYRRRSGKSTENWHILTLSSSQIAIKPPSTA
jgi:hypothetical protein